MRQTDKSDLPLPVLFYKYFLLRYSFSILSLYSPKSTFLAAALPKNSKKEPPSPIFLVFDPLPHEEMAINFVVPEVSLPSFFLCTLLLYSYSSAIPFTEYPLFLFVLSSSKFLGFG